MQRGKVLCGDFFKAFDVFTSPVNLRYEKEPQYDTLTGGCFSFGLIILLVSLFYSSWMDLLNKKSINANEAMVRELDPNSFVTSTNEFMFALGVIGINLNSNDTRYFNLSLKAIFRDEARVKHQVNVPLIQCTVDQWNHFGPDFQDTFNRFQIQKFKCPPSNYTLHFDGKFTSANFSYLMISFSSCSGSDCKSAAQFTSYVQSNRAFYLDFFYTNTLLNKDQLIPTQTVFQDKTYLLLSDKLGMDMNVYVSEYNMVTDNSLFPWSQNQVNKGLMVNKDEQQQISYIPNSGRYSTIYIRKSDNVFNIQRSFRKLDDMLSYIGGLFGIIAVAFGVLVGYYSQCSYELTLSRNIFEYHEENQPQQDLNPYPNRDGIQQTQISCQTANESNKQSVKAKKNKKKTQDMDPTQFHFGDYLIYLFFLSLKKIGCKPKWKKMVMYDDTLDEMRHQMDINILLQKVTFYDKAIHTLFDQHQLKLLYLQQKFNIIDIKKERQMLNLGFEILNLFDLEKNPSEIQASNFEGVQFNNQALSRPQIFTHKTIGTKRNISPSPFDMLVNSINKKDKGNDNQIPDQIQCALQTVQEKMRNGDLVSKRIYEGLDPTLIQKYQGHAKEDLDKLDQAKKRRLRASVDRLSGRSSFLNIIGKNVKRI